MDINALASSGITGAVIVGFYIFYKLFVKKKCNSKCCCGEVSIEETPSHHPKTPPESPRPKIEV
jgi:hypothetical protein